MKTKQFNFKRTLIAGGVTFLSSALIVLVFFQSKEYLSGPTIIINSPQNGVTINNSFIKVEGLAKRVSFITLNDRQIYVDEEGKINEDMLLQNGYNIISIKATDRFNRRVESRLELIYQ